MQSRALKNPLLDYIYQSFSSTEHLYWYSLWYYLSLRITILLRILWIHFTDNTAASAWTTFWNYLKYRIKEHKTIFCCNFPSQPILLSLVSISKLLCLEISKRLFKIWTMSKIVICRSQFSSKVHSVSTINPIFVLSICAYLNCYNNLQKISLKVLLLPNNTCIHNIFW